MGCPLFVSMLAFIILKGQMQSGHGLRTPGWFLQSKVSSLSSVSLAYRQCANFYFFKNITRHIK
jgi:hypothetical protein